MAHQPIVPGNNGCLKWRGRLIKGCFANGPVNVSSAKPCKLVGFYCLERLLQLGHMLSVFNQECMEDECFVQFNN